MAIWVINPLINIHELIALTSYRSDCSSKRSFRLHEFSSAIHRNSTLSFYSDHRLVRKQGDFEKLDDELFESKVTLKSSDDELFHVTEAVASECGAIKNMIEDIGTASAIPLPNVSSKILSKVIDYCKYHVESQMPAQQKSEDEIKTWDQEFVKVDLATLFELILGANYVDNKKLLDLTCQAVADVIKGKTAEEIRKIFNIKNDFIPEEEEEVRRENQWAFE